LEKGNWKLVSEMIVLPEWFDLQNLMGVAEGSAELRDKNGTPDGWAVPLIPPPERTDGAGVPVTGNVILRLSKICQLLFLLNCWHGSTHAGSGEVVLGLGGGDGESERGFERGN
jgi:hypothetical protein